MTAAQYSKLWLTRRAFSSLRVIRRQTWASWTIPRFETKLTDRSKNEGFSDFDLFQSRIPKFIFALPLGKRYFYTFSVAWCKSQVLGIKRAGAFNSFRVSPASPPGRKSQISWKFRFEAGQNPKASPWQPRNISNYDWLVEHLAL